MPQKRKNKSAWVGNLQRFQRCFINNKRRQRRRAKIAKLSRRKNRA